jgi:hypothetical protein
MKQQRISYANTASWCFVLKYIATYDNKEDSMLDTVQKVPVQANRLCWAAAREAYGKIVTVSPAVPEAALRRTCMLPHDLFGRYIVRRGYRTIAVKTLVLSQSDKETLRRASITACWLPKTFHLYISVRRAA